MKASMKMDLYRWQVQVQLPPVANAAGTWATVAAFAWHGHAVALGRYLTARGHTVQVQRVPLAVPA